MREQKRFCYSVGDNSCTFAIEKIEKVCEKANNYGTEQSNEAK